MKRPTLRVSSFNYYLSLPSSTITYLSRKPIPHHPEKMEGSSQSSIHQDKSHSQRRKNRSTYILYQKRRAHIGVEVKVAIFLPYKKTRQMMRQAISLFLNFIFSYTQSASYSQKTYLIRQQELVLFKTFLYI